MMARRLAAAVISMALALALAAAAEPAPWFKWKSRLDHRIACAQTSLGPGWDLFSGPYRDVRCEQRVRAPSG